MKPAVLNLNRAFDNLEALEKLCGSIQRRIDNGMDLTPEWLSGAVGLIKGSSMAAKTIVSDEAAIMAGLISRETIAKIEQGIAIPLEPGEKMQVQSQDGNVVRIGPSKSYQKTGGDCA